MDKKTANPDGRNPVDNMGTNKVAPSVPVEDKGVVVETPVKNRN